MASSLFDDDVDNLFDSGGLDEVEIDDGDAVPGGFSAETVDDGIDEVGVSGGFSAETVDDGIDEVGISGGVATSAQRGIRFHQDPLTVSTFVDLSSLSVLSDTDSRDELFSLYQSLDTSDDNLLSSSFSFAAKEKRRKKERQATLRHKGSSSPSSSSSSCFSSNVSVGGIYSRRVEITSEESARGIKSGISFSSSSSHQSSSSSASPSSSFSSSSSSSEVLYEEDISSLSSIDVNALIKNQSKERSTDLITDLNTLIEKITEWSRRVYPFNESLDRFSQRLDKFSTKNEMFLDYRPQLILKHKRKKKNSNSQNGLGEELHINGDKDKESCHYNQMENDDIDHQRRDKDIDHQMEDDFLHYQRRDEDLRHQENTYSQNKTNSVITPDPEMESRKKAAKQKLLEKRQMIQKNKVTAGEHTNENKIQNNEKVEVNRRREEAIERLRLKRLSLKTAENAT